MRSISFLFLLFFFPAVVFSQTSETPFATVEVDVNAVIPDNGAPLESSITIPSFGLLDDLRIAVRISHPNVEELRISLTSPTGLRTFLHNQSPSGTNPFNPVYDTITEPATPLNVYHGINAQGTWTLTVEDVSAGNEGVLESWGMMVNPVTLLDTPPPTPVPIIPSTEFSVVSTFPASASASRLLCGDVNFDGLDDAILLSQQNDAMVVYPSNGTGFESPRMLDVNDPQDVVISDLNLDGVGDLVAAATSAFGLSSIVTVFIGTDDGGYSKGFTAELQTQMQHLAVYDADFDSIPDIVIGGEPLWLKGNGDGSFQPQQELVFLGDDLIASADINSDGLDDVLVTINRGGTSQNDDPFVILADEENLFPFIRDDGTKVELNGTFLQALTASTRVPGKEEFIVLSQSQEAEPVQLFTTIRTDSTGLVSVIESRLAPDTLLPPVKSFDVNGDGLDEFLFVSANGVDSFQKNPETVGGETRTVLTDTSIKLICPGLYFDDGTVGMAAVNENNEFLLLQSNLGARPTPPQFITPTQTPTSSLFITPTPTPTAPAIPNTPTPLPGLQGDPDLNGDGRVDKLDLLLLIQSWGNQN